MTINDLLFMARNSVNIKSTWMIRFKEKETDPLKSVYISLWKSHNFFSSWLQSSGRQGNPTETSDNPYSQLSVLVWKQVSRIVYLSKDRNGGF